MNKTSFLEKILISAGRNLLRRAAKMNLRTGSSSIQSRINSRTAIAIETWIKEKEYCKSGPGLAETAIQLGISQEQLSYFFSSVMKKNFMQWRKELRIMEAMEIMNNAPHISQRKLAVMVGIPDRANFKRQFREVTGTAFSEYRESLLGDLYGTTDQA